MYPKLNFPELFSFKYKKERNYIKIWDDFRKGYFVFTPEEWVRQNTLQYLIYKGYPKPLISVEKQVSGTNKRFDVLVYDRKGNPFLIIECKSFSETLNQNILDQASRYNLTLKTPYLMLTNGLNHIYSQIILEENKMIFLKDLPEFS